MSNIVISDFNYQSIDIERGILNQPDIALKDYQCRTEEDVIAAAKDCDVLIVQFAPVTRKVIESLSRCKAIVRYAIGVDNIDLDAASQRGIYVVNVPDYGIDEVSTSAVTLLLAAIRQLSVAVGAVRSGCWDYAATKPLHRTKGARLGLVGLGRIPVEVAKKMAGFGMDIVAFDPYVDESVARDCGVRLVSFDQLVSTSDYISIHCPLTSETHHLFHKEVFARMKPTAILINTARGSVINEIDLAQACKDRVIAAAAIDVAEVEPIPQDSPLLSLDNVIITPHMAWYSEESIVALKTAVATEALRAARGEMPKNIVNRKELAARVRCGIQGAWK